MNQPIPRKKKKDPLIFIAACGSGLEDIVTGEIIAAGGENPQKSPGAVCWQGSLESAYRLCLWSRFASRILLRLDEFSAPDTDTLYQRAKEITWDDHFSPASTFAVFCTLSGKTTITHNKFAALRVKDAIADQFRARLGKRPNVDAAQPDIRIHLHIQEQQASLSLDLSGESLHRRGYRIIGGEAPLKETLAAALVQLSGFTASFAELVFLDPMCGSGTLLIEAALIYGDSAPGLYRKSFGFLAWNRHSPILWDKLVQEALAREEASRDKPWPQFIGYDVDPRLIGIAKKNIEQAGLDHRIVVKQQPLAWLRRPASRGLMVVNPPYGERLAEKEEVKYLYRCLGRLAREEFAGWRLGLFTSNPDMADMLKLKWTEQFRLFNGPLKCRLLLTECPESEIAAPPSLQLQELAEPGNSADFANRLRKNFQTLNKWAAKENISCFRLYDADIPEYNLAVDIYGEWVQVQEYAAPATVAPEKAKERFQEALRIIRELLGVPHSRLFLKLRKRQKGSDQYQKRAEGGKLYEVRENPCRFLVNFTDYLDTGLFLDHRLTRDLIRKSAAEKKFLNLFGYTGTATVHAAMGGARATTTVDTSATYLGRARANLALNGFGGPLHQTVEADCLEWLREATDRYDLIFVDPPTFSNARHRGLTFDVQRDHSELLRLAMNRLTPDGLLVFSTNFRKFQLDEALQRGFNVTEISDQTIPLDFQRNPRIHRCWEIRHDHC